jgi:hypothetical protein
MDTTILTLLGYAINLLHKCDMFTIFNLEPFQDTNEGSELHRLNQVESAAQWYATTATNAERTTCYSFLVNRCPAVHFIRTIHEGDHGLFLALHHLPVRCDESAVELDQVAHALGRTPLSSLRMSTCDTKRSRFI